MTVTFDTPAGPIGGGDALGFATTAKPTAISLKFLPDVGPARWDTVYGDTTHGDDGTIAPRWAAIGVAHVGLYYWTISAPPGGWPCKVRLVVDELGAGSAHAEYTPPPFVAPEPAELGEPVALPQTVFRTFRDAAREITPWWLRGPRIGSVLYAMGSVADTLADALRAGVKSRFPGLYSGETLPLIGRERRIRRGRNESDETYASRLLPWLDHHRLRGGPYAMLEQLHAFYAPFNFPVELRYASGRRYTLSSFDGTISRDDVIWTPPGDPAQWARWWLIFDWPGDIGDDGLWSDPGTWDDGGVWDCSLSASEVRDIRLIPREWNAAHALGFVTIEGNDNTITISVEAS